MELIKASEVKRKQMYTESRIAELISSAMHVRSTNAYVNSDLITDKQVQKLKDLGYSIYNTGGRMEISWQHA